VKPSTFKSGYTLVIGGPNFVPEDFLRDSPLKPRVIHRGDTYQNDQIADESWLEWSDIHDGTYPLNAGWEAMDFIRENRDALFRLSRFPGITGGSLNFFGDAKSCCLEFKQDDIALLHALSMSISIVPY